MRRENVLVPKLRGNGTQLLDSFCFSLWGSMLLLSTATPGLRALSAEALQPRSTRGHAVGRSLSSRMAYFFVDSYYSITRRHVWGIPILIAYGLPFGGFIATGSWG